MQLTYRAPKKDIRRWVGLSDAGIESRDAILHRARATVWHVALIEDRLSAAVSHMNRDRASVLELTSDPKFAWAVQRDLSHLLDDVVFNAVSLLDYTSHLWASLFNLNYQDRHTWLRSAKRARRVVAGTSSDYPIALAHAIIEADENWVRGIDGFRGVLIHREVSMGSGKQSLDPMTFTASLSFSLPDALTAAVPAILPTEHPVELILGTRAITTHCLRLVTSLVHLVTTQIAARPAAIP